MNPSNFLPSNSPYSSLTFVALQAALSAGTILKRGFGTDFDISSKPGSQNLVTAYDNASEECIFECLKQHFPQHDILSEESSPETKENKEVIWIVDPLDGTVNFAHQIPIFSVSIAAAYKGEIVSGIVYHPMAEELFVAEKGRGAYLNGKRLKVTETTEFEKAMMATGFPYNVHQNPMHCIDFFGYMTSLGIPIRRLGSAAIDLAYVAAGRFDAYWEVSLFPWDRAAGKLLVEEAGGKVTQYNGDPHSLTDEQSMVATNGPLHPKILSELKAVL